ncbi:ceramide glucosyltransferase [Microdochium trichocladiopsis]|uniref:Ceramide glucosyltransferase n=1 Tax=Microdochium trichocladiopsis TaxID=1682393 RepID=A0A9P8Y9R7_9PEZI|nr:ceramide glucosyltransferase [Microdochium trichocladiopsis]KAH7033692.1 ceramide glucosyltransferase [Microdochium trichocladiopsis]
MAPLPEVLGYIGLVWGCVVVVVQTIGITQLFRNYSTKPPKPVSPALPRDKVPHVTILRPVKGLEPGLYDCLASSFHQAYPSERLTLHFCVSDPDDAALPTLRKLLKDFPKADARIFIESEDPLLHGPDGNVNNVGPNPKIRNLSRAYREAKGDIIWAVDCNVWVSPGTLGRLVDRLCGYSQPGGPKVKPVKFVHQLPIVVDTVSSMAQQDGEGRALLSGASITGSSDSSAAVHVPSSLLARWRTHGGGRLEEQFMATTHAKFYCAINAVGVAPCALGKSNMFRKSHIDRVTDASRNPTLAGTSAASLPQGLDHFSYYLCEDHAIGDLLWRSPIKGFDNHGLAAGDLAVQPVAGMSVVAYWSRRVRWLRARKWTVLAATLVEHAVESLVCNLYFSYGLTTVPFVHELTGIPQTWRAMGIAWLIGVTTWMAMDRVVFKVLYRGDTIEVNDGSEGPSSAATPRFARGFRHGGDEKRPFGEWFLGWLGREILALPIWTWAVLLGGSVTWRGKRFRVRSDMTVVAIDPDTEADSDGSNYNDDETSEEEEEVASQRTTQRPGRRSGGPRSGSISSRSRSKNKSKRTSNRRKA